jgi:hypothetical protein
MTYGFASEPPPDLTYGELANDEPPLNIRLPDTSSKPFIGMGTDTMSNKIVIMIETKMLNLKWWGVILF